MLKSILLAATFSLLAASAHAGPSLQQQKEAFRDEFLSAKIAGSMIRNEFNKYNLHPSEFSDQFRSESKLQTKPLLVVKFTRDYDSLGRLVISPKLQYKPMSPEDFPSGAYVNSLLDFQKDTVFSAPAPAPSEVYEVIQ